MTIKELIKQLSQYDNNTEVLIDTLHGYCKDIHYISKEKVWKDHKQEEMIIIKVK